MRRSFLLPVFLFLFWGIPSTSFAQKDKEEPPIERPLSQWVFKTVVDDLPGAVVVALHKDIWLAYNPVSADIYRAWKGKVKLQGAIYTGISGEQPAIDGFPFINKPFSQQHDWRVKINGQEETPKVMWRGYKKLENSFTAMYSLRLSNGMDIEIEEQAEYMEVKRAGNRSGFQRSFTITRGPTGAEVSLGMAYDGMVRRADIQTSSKFKDVEREKRHFEWGTLYNFSGRLMLSQDEPTVLNLTFAIDPEQEASTTGSN
ncbi:MAG: hypothetical protein AAF587_23835 [Bacteroidota bacterium]